MRTSEFKHLKKVVLAALFSALTFVLTFLSVPVPPGCVNLGDGILLFGVSVLGLPGIFAGAVGAALADLTGAYSVYLPATLLIKFLMGSVALLILKGSFQKGKRLLAGVIPELVMVCGYFFYEAFFLGLGAGAWLSVPFNLLQGAVAVAVFLILSRLPGGKRL